MYSSKKILISLPSKLVLKFSGVLFTMTGGNESLFPPEGLPRFAQSTNESENRHRMSKLKALCLYVYKYAANCFKGTKITSFLLGYLLSPFYNVIAMVARLICAAPCAKR